MEPSSEAKAHTDHGHDHGHGDGHGHGEHHVNYVKIYYVLLALLGASIAGPMFGHPVITLITAFGIALVKAYLVASNFMHLKVEKRYISYLLLTAIAFMFLFYAGVAPDVMKHRGRQWENVAAQDWSKQAVEQAAREHAEHG